MEFKTHDHELVIPEQPEPIPDDKREKKNESKREGTCLVLSDGWVAHPQN